MRLIFDIEANGLYDTVDTIWCICAKDLDTGEKYEWTVESSRSDWDNFHVIFNKATELVGHNIINYDLPTLKKIAFWIPNENTKITDTLVMSRLANPDRPKPPRYTGKGGPHSLEAWGYRVGKGKPEHNEWHVFSPDMLRRCREDVEINYLTYYSVASELKDFSEESIEIEHQIAKIITEQEHYGIRFDVDNAKKFIKYLDQQIEKIDNEILPKLPKTLLVGGPFQRVRFVSFDIGSTTKIKDYLLENGWQPDFWNISKTTGERSSPKLEGEFRGITGDIPRKVRERITWRHRRSQIEGWIRNVRIIYTDTISNTANMVDSDGNVNITDGSSGGRRLYCLPAGANPCGAPTGRMYHSTVVNIPKANTNKKTKQLIWTPERQKVIFGTQMRSLFIPRDGYVLVGHDAAGIELRMLAHYMDDKDFINEILSGDVHEYNRFKAGLPTRDAAKTFIYALIYGAGDAKIGAIIGGDANDGRDIKREYFAAIPKLEKFISSVKRAAGRGWLKGLDGRKLILRKDDSGRIQRNKGPNTLLQSGATIVMKKSCILLWSDIVKNNIHAHKVLDMHDEGQSEVWNEEDNINRYCELAVDSIVKAGQHFNLNIPLDGEAKVGMNMAETH